MFSRTQSCLVCSFFALVIFGAAPTLALADAIWYYCEPSHAYYPFVSTCAVPWRQIVPNSGAYHPPFSAGQQVVAAPTGPPSQETTAPQASSAYRDGQADRQAWETWFAAQTGDARNGAYYWSGQRSLPKPGACNTSPPSTGPEWTEGCFAAQRKLATSDARRKTEPEYRSGWNNPEPIPPVDQSTTTAPAAPPANDATAGIAIAPAASTYTDADRPAAAPPLTQAANSVV